MKRAASAITAIALTSFREAVRDKILYLLLFFGLLLIGTSRIISWLTVGAEIKIIIDVGLAAANLFGVLLAIFIGISIVYKEIERRTIYVIVPKPIHRYEFILGKFAGLAVTLLIVLGVMSAMLQLAVFLKTWTLSYPVFRACVLLYFELLVIVSLAVLFSSFSTPILSFIFTLMLYLIGHWSYSLLDLAARAPGSVAPTLLRTLYYVLPNLENFNLKTAAVHDIAIPPGFVTSSMVYGVLYTSAVLILSMGIFQKRDFS